MQTTLRDVGNLEWFGSYFEVTTAVRFCAWFLNLFFMSKSLFSAAFGILVGWYAAKPYDLSVYGTSDIYYVKGLTLGTETGRIDSTFKSMDAMSAFLDSISAAHSNEFFEWNAKSIMTYTEVEVVNGKVLVRVPDVSGDSMIVVKMNAVDTTDSGTIHYVLD